MGKRKFIHSAKGNTVHKPAGGKPACGVRAQEWRERQLTAAQYSSGAWHTCAHCYWTWPKYMATRWEYVQVWADD